MTIWEVHTYMYKQFQNNTDTLLSDISATVFAVWLDILRTVQEMIVERVLST